MLNEPKFLKELPDGTFTEDLTGAKLPNGLNFENVSNIPTIGNFPAPVDVAFIAGENINQGDLVKVQGASVFKVTPSPLPPVPPLNAPDNPKIPVATLPLTDTTTYFHFPTHLYGNIFAFHRSNAIHNGEFSTNVWIIDVGTQSILHTYTFSDNVYSITPVPNTTKFAVYTYAGTNLSITLCDTTGFTQSSSGVVNVGFSGSRFCRNGQVYVESPTSFYFFLSGAVNSQLYIAISKTSDTAITTAAHIVIPNIKAVPLGYGIISGHDTNYCLVMQSGTKLVFFHRYNSYIHRNEYTIDLSAATYLLTLDTAPTYIPVNLSPNYIPTLKLYDTNKIAYLSHQGNPTVGGVMRIGAISFDINTGTIFPVSPPFYKYTQETFPISRENWVVLEDDHRVFSTAIIGLGYDKVLVLEMNSDFFNNNKTFADYAYNIDSAMNRKLIVSGTVSKKGVLTAIPVIITGLSFSTSPVLVFSLPLVEPTQEKPLNYFPNNEYPLHLIATENKLTGQSVSCRIVGECPFYSGLTPGVMYYSNNGTNNIPSQSRETGDVEKGIALSSSTLLIRKIYHA